MHIELRRLFGGLWRDYSGANALAFLLGLYLWSGQQQRIEDLTERSAYEHARAEALSAHLAVRDQELAEANLVINAIQMVSLINQANEAKWAGMSPPPPQLDASLNMLVSIIAEPDPVPSPAGDEGIWCLPEGRGQHFFSLCREPVAPSETHAHRMAELWTSRRRYQQNADDYRDAGN